jgi:hypothetical protein
LCLAAFVSSYAAGKRSTGSGVAAVLGWGYFYGLLRAYFAGTGGYFIFDSALVGLYLAHFVVRTESDRQPTQPLKTWVLILIAWPSLLVLLPLQPILISLVGLRASVLVLPAMLLGSRLRDEDLSKLSVALSFLNIAVLIVAAMEYTLGLERIFPRNDVTTLIYGMNDVAGYTAYRIPGTFSQAHVYAGTMICTIPFLFGAWVQSEIRRSARCILLILGMAAALLGILLAAARMAFAIAVLIMIFATLKSGFGAKKRMAWYAMILCTATITIANERLQRFTSLSDGEYVESRIAGSVNRRFLEVLFEYPIGNGLGGGGTSIPYFLEPYVKNPVVLENEYARILLEETVFGLALWIAFLVWAFSRPTAFVRTVWHDGRRLAWFTCFLFFCSGFIGIGLFTSAPESVLIFLMLGWFSTRPRSALDGVTQNRSAVVLRGSAALGTASWSLASGHSKRTGRL